MTVIRPDERPGDGRAAFLSALQVTQDDYEGLGLDHLAKYNISLVELAKWNLTNYETYFAEVKVPSTAAAGSFYEATFPPLPRDAFILGHVQLITNKQVGVTCMRNATASDLNGYANIAFRTQFSNTIDYAYHFVEYKYESAAFEEVIHCTPVLSAENQKHFEFDRSLREYLPRFFPWPIGGDGRRNNWRAQIEIGIGSAPGEDVEFYATLGVHTANGAPAK